MHVLHLLGQTTLPQGIVSKGVPTQSLPSSFGEGLEQLLDLVLSLFPHVDEHVDHADQLDHPPSTER